jgi:hypothetical protein
MLWFLFGATAGQSTEKSLPFHFGSSVSLDTPRVVENLCESCGLVVHKDLLDESLGAD